MGDPIAVSAVIIRDQEGKVLTVRKRGTHLLMFPGGKPEAGESAPETAVREVAEELGVALDLAALRSLGEFSAPAANEESHQVLATVFEHPYIAVGSPLAEIEQIQWVDPSDPSPDLAPLLRDAVFPLLG